ncbi:MAG: hypothetical protein HZA22_11000 [Nitrospirae bacterium]|nr:hypothetical protein [Nitrospirota bacterium]MBI5695226.1 hypothetical protein [Nitrospirota bacterium]
MAGRRIRYTALCLMLALALQSAFTGGVCLMPSSHGTTDGRDVVAALDVCGHSGHTVIQSGPDAPYILSMSEIRFHSTSASYPAFPAIGLSSFFSAGPKEPPEA